MSSSAKAQQSSLQRLAQVLPHYVSRTDSHISRINSYLARLIATTSTLDTTLLTITYTLHLLHALLSRITTFRLSIAAESLGSLLSQLSYAVPRSSTFFATLTPSPTSRLFRLTTSTAALAALIDDVRIFLRLGGLFSIYTWGASTYRSPPQDRVLRSIAWGQIGACALFQYLENGAYLGSKGVFAFGNEKVNKWYVWSSRFWMAHVILEFGRLARQWSINREEPPSKDVRSERQGDKVNHGQVLARREEEDRELWRQVYVNAAWFPVTVHYGSESGLVGEAQLALLGLVAGVLGIRDAWRATDDQHC
ncbi:hypothetical protein MMC17_003139 [Xylographa soralifera]|nr:hypothetical protein [Xylographa soralifera]